MLVDYVFLFLNLLKMKLIGLHAKCYSTSHKPITTIWDNIRALPSQFYTGIKQYYNNHKQIKSLDLNNRRDYILLHQHRQDTRIIIPIAIVGILLPELFLLAYFYGKKIPLPSTLRIPFYQDKFHGILVEKRIALAQQFQVIYIMNLFEIHYWK